MTEMTFFSFCYYKILIFSTFPRIIWTNVAVKLIPILLLLFYYQRQRDDGSTENPIFIAAPQVSENRFMVSKQNFNYRKYIFPYLLFLFLYP